MPVPSVLNDYYSAYYADSNDLRNRDAAVTLDRPRRLARRVVRCSSRPPALARVLDFGGGDGAISRAIGEELRSRGSREVEITLVDYRAESYASPDGFIRVSASRELPPSGAQFDIALASGILEHLPKPLPPLLHVLESVAPGGLFYARTPAVAEIMQLATGLGFSFDFTFPAHVHDLGQNFWDRALANLGLESEYEIVHSRPSIVETTFDRHPLRTVGSLLAKAPWWVLGDRWKMIGGWEVFFRRVTSARVRAAT